MNLKYHKNIKVLAISLLCNFYRDSACRRDWNRPGSSRISLSHQGR